MTLHDTEVRASGSPPPPQRPPTPGGFSIGPAMVVAGLAVLILVVFVTIGILTTQKPAPVRHSTASNAVAGSSIKAQQAATRLTPIIVSGEPPANILNAVDLPAGAVRVSHQNNAAGSGQFDAQVLFRSDDSQAALLAFYAADMKLQGWQIYDKGPAANDPGALEVLGKLAGTDGYYWEMGATISPTSFGPGAPPTGQTDFTVRLFQQGDEQN
ncbi:MAG TPA: hypothetical protein VHD39_03305 [Acidimicrobiales bacterium]|nr:hypothetical protein [Acidimicrobiales bacterium]